MIIPHLRISYEIKDNDMPVMTATKINGKWHLPGLSFQTLCGLVAARWELIGSVNPVSIKDVCEECYQLAMNTTIVVQTIKSKL